MLFKYEQVSMEMFKINSRIKALSMFPYNKLNSHEAQVLEHQLKSFNKLLIAFIGDNKIIKNEIFLSQKKIEDILS